MSEQAEENAYAYTREPRVAVNADQQVWPRRNGFVVVADQRAIAIIDVRASEVTYYGHATPRQPAWASPTMPLASAKKPRFPRVGEAWKILVVHPTHGPTAINMKSVDAVRFVMMSG